jgi:5-methylcytosine-specific restriction endonuclease McrA
MNKLDRPPYDDNAALDALANNKKAGSYPRLQRHVRTLKVGYAQYLAANGNVSAINMVTLPKVTAKFLRGHYGSPPQAIAHITQMRVESDSKTCSMCGSLHSGTLDHVMDKEDHPAFSIFAQNLVPACKCNSKRLKALVGPNPGERILHPYFDGVLGERIVAARFTDLGPVPRVETRIILNPASPHFAAAAFHHDSVVMRTSIHSYLFGRWIKLMQRPGTIVPYLKEDPVNRADLVAIIEDDRDRVDNSRDSKNNWDSVFRSGLLDSDVIDWLYARFARPGRLPNTSLL